MSKFLFFLSLLVYSSLACKNGESMIKETVNRISSQIPEMIANLTDREECETDELQSICHKGYTYWNSVSESHYFKGIYSDYENIDSFFDVIFDSYSFSQSEIDKIKSIFFSLEFNDDVDVLGIETIFEKYNTTSGTFLSLMFEKNCQSEYEYDFLINMINSKFKLEDEVFFISTNEGNLSSEESIQRVIKEPSVLSRNQLDALILLFEIAIYENAERIINLLDMF